MGGSPRLQRAGCFSIPNYIKIAVLFFFAAVQTQSSADAQQRACTPTQRGKIVGGSPAKIDDWPSLVSLRLHSENGAVSKHFCGGSVVNDRWVLTAAHCLHDHLTKLTALFQDAAGKSYEGRLEVVIGVEDLKTVPPERVIEAERIEMHPRYREATEKALQIGSPFRRAQALQRIAVDIGDDIALVRLARPWQGGAVNLSLVAASDPGEASVEQVRVAGFGTTEANKDDKTLTLFVRADRRSSFYAGSDKLLETAIGLVPLPNCKGRYETSAIGIGQICAGLKQGGKDSCQGDSGGPLVIEDDGRCPRQIGIVSWGASCAESEAYGVYTRVSHHADWIQRHTGPLYVAMRDQAPKPIPALLVTQVGEALRHLDGLLGQTRGRVKVRIAGGNRVKLGAKVNFEVTSSIGGRLVLIDINVKREVTLIYPNQYVEQSDLGHIQAGARLMVPEPNYQGFTSFKAVEPVGKGRLVALVVPDEFEIERFAAERHDLTKGFVPRNDPPSYLMRVIRQIERAIAARGSAGGSGSAAELAEWGYQLVEYEIVH